MKKPQHDELASRLRKVRADVRCAFAAACAERLFPWVERVNSSLRPEAVPRVRKALGTVWKIAKSGAIEVTRLNQLTEELQNYIIEEPSRHEWVIASDAGVYSVLFAMLSAKNETAMDAARAGNQAREAACQYVAHLIVGSGFITKEDITAVLNHPIVQAEVQRQSEDIHDLQAVTDSDRSKMLEGLRKRARAAGPTFFGNAPTPA